MKTSSSAQLKTTPVAADARDDYRDDPRWKLAQSVVAGPHFSRSALLSKFLLYVVAETLKERQHAISEHKIGVVVFGRPTNYRTDEDNIVRNYARQLRRRLADHFATEGRDAPMRIDIPVGGYIPSFRAAPVPLRSELEDMPSHGLSGKGLRAAHSAHLATGVRRALLVLLPVVIVLGTGGAAAYHYLAQPHTRDETQVLWRNLMPDARTTYIVPADAGLNLMEDLTRRSVPLADYINGAYGTLPTTMVDAHAAQDLHTQQYTDFVSAETISMVARRPEFNPQRVRALFPRELRLSDLKTANALIIGSSTSNPWASVADVDTNFGIVTQPDMGGAEIVNRHPRAGERSVYTSNWNQAAHETFALILYGPNLSRTGNILLIEGLDVAGTQSAAEALLQSQLAVPILKLAARPDGTLHSFEILLRTTSIQSNAEGTQILASRID